MRPAPRFFHSPLHSLAPVALILAACYGDNAQNVTSPQGFSPTANVQQIFAGRPIEQDFAYLAARIPGFAGYHLDTSGTTLVVRTTRGALTGSEVQLVRAQVLNALPRARRQRSSAGDMTTQIATFDFAQLQRWRDAILDSTQQGPYPLTYIDLDEIANKVAVGVEFSSAVQTLNDLASRLGVPAAAIAVEVASPAQFIQDPTLNDRIRPLQGGTQVTAEPTTTTGRCTMTIPAWYPARNENVIITASHCSNIRWGPDNGDGGRIQQPLSITTPPPPGQNFFGAEIHDESGWSCWMGGIHSSCRHAEVSAYSIANLEFISGDSVSFRLGRIARPYLVRAGSQSTIDDPAALRIDPPLPYFTITGTREFPVANQWVEKIGRRTGWTYARVHATCRDYRVMNQWWIMCSDQADLGVWEGDSGSPIFELNGTGWSVTFVGMLSARIPSRPNSPGTYAGVFSNFRQMKADMGTFNVF